MGTSIAQVGANMVSKGPSWRQNAFMAVQVHAKVALSESKLAPIWAKLGSRAQSDSKLSLSGPLLQLNWVKMASVLHEG